MIVICFDDSADGKAHITEIYERTIFLNIQFLFPFLKKHDHICVAEKDIYYRLGDADFSAYAPYSITLEMGEKVNVNKL